MKPYLWKTDTIRFYDTTYPLFLYYDIVLDCFQISARQDLDDWTKIDIVLEILTRRNHKAMRLPANIRQELHNEIFKQKINLNKRKGKAGPRTVDLIADFDLIYASFMQAYHIDLYEQRGLLSWPRFFDLFQGLPEDTKIREVMGISGRDIPSPTKYNQKTIQNLIELKQYWALPPTPGMETNYQEQIELLFRSIKNMYGR